MMLPKCCEKITGAERAELQRKEGSDTSLDGGHPKEFLLFLFESQSRDSVKFIA